MAADAIRPQARFATTADAPACNEFYNRLHGTNRTVAQWEWEFAPEGGDPSAYVILENEGSVVGLQALIPVRLIGPAGVHETAKSEDTLLDPAMRGTGAFAAMYALIFDRAREAGIEAIWGFTEATRSFERVGFAVPGVTRRLALPLSGGAAQLLEGRFRGSAGRLVFALAGKPVMWAVARAARVRRALGRRRRESASPGLRIVTASAPPDDCESLMHSFIETWGGVTILRDSHYLSWRVFSNPWVRPVMRCAYDGDELVGWVVYAVGRRRVGYVVDVIAANAASSKESAEHVAKILLADAAKGLAAAGAVAAVLMTATEHPFDAAVRRACASLGFLSAGQGNPAVLWTPSTDSPLAPFDEWYVTRIFTEGVDG